MRRFWSWVLACALLAAHTLGAVHGVAHARAGGPTASATKSFAAAPLSGLFKTHDDGSGCRLFDQLSHGDAVPTTVAILAPVPLASCAGPVAAAVATASAPHVRARGPPLLA